MLKIIRADPKTVEAALGFDVDMPAIAVLGVDHGKVVGSGGLAWGRGKCWLWFAMPISKPGYAVAVLREARRLLKRAVQLGETSVFTPRDDEFPRSAKLLQMLGFERDGSMVAFDRQMEVWRWDK